MKTNSLSFFILVVSIMPTFAYTQKIQVVTEDLAPYNYVVNNEIVGSNTRLVKYLLASQALDYTINAYPWARSYQIALKKKNVLIYTINRTPAREAKFHWIGRFPLTTEIAFYRLKSPLLINTDFTRLKELRVGTQINTANDQFLVQHDFKHISRVSHIKQTIGMLLLGRVDLIIGSKEQIKQELIASGHPLSTVEYVAPAFMSEPSLAMSKQTPIALVERLRTAYQQLLAHDVCHIMQIPAANCKKSSALPVQ